MKFKQILFFLLFFSYLSSFAQTNYTISGYVQENESGENLIGVSIYDKNTFKGTVTNQYGFYSLTLEEGNYEIIYSFIGLQSITKNVNLNKDTRLTYSVVETRQLFKDLKTLSFRKIIMYKLKNY